MKKVQIAEDQAHNHTVSLLHSLVPKADVQEEVIKKPSIDKYGEELNNKEHTEELIQAINNVILGKIYQAKPTLVKTLKETPKNSEAWLWFARVSDNLKAINISLNNASAISPENREIAEERLKVNSAVATGCNESSQLKHCFFCWAPVLKGHSTCHYCNAHLDIHEDFFHSKFFDDPKKPTEPKFILEALQIFSKTTALEPRNALVHFFLAMTHINMDQWDEALDELLLTKSINPGNNPYEKQLEILSDFMDDLGSFFSEDNQIENQPVATEKPSEKDKRILVVEDSTTTRTVIRKMLNQQGYIVIEAKDGLDALDKFEEITPDLIMLDIIMPGMNGYQTFSTLKKSHNLDDIPVIMLSAKGNLIDKVKGKMVGATEFLTKPFNALQLMKKVKQHLIN